MGIAVPLSNYWSELNTYLNYFGVHMPLDYSLPIYVKVSYPKTCKMHQNAGNGIYFFKIFWGRTLNPPTRLPLPHYKCFRRPCLYDNNTKRMCYVQQNWHTYIREWRHHIYHKSGGSSINCWVLLFKSRCIWHHSLLFQILDRYVYNLYFQVWTFIDTMKLWENVPHEAWFNDLHKSFVVCTSKHMWDLTVLSNQLTTKLIYRTLGIQRPDIHRQHKLHITFLIPWLL